MGRILDLIDSCDIDDHRGQTAIKLSHEVSAADYATFKTIAEYAGGVYAGKAIGHLFATRPDTTMSVLRISAGRLEAGSKLNAAEFFPTPPTVSEQIFGNRHLDQDSYMGFKLSGESAHPVRVLEPSAGDGALIAAMLSAYPTFNGRVVAVEGDALRAEILRDRFADKPVDVVEDDFLSLGKEDIGTFDLVMMNPPFGDWPRHIAHARALLKDGDSVLASVLPDLKNIARKRQGDDRNAALDLMADATTYLADLEPVESGAFARHGRGKRGSAVTTQTSTCLYFCGQAAERDHAVRQEVIDVVAPSRSEIYDAVKNVMARSWPHGPLDEASPSIADIDRMMAPILEYIAENRTDLILDSDLPLHSLQDPKGLAATMMLSLWNEISSEATNHLYSIMEAAAKSPEQYNRHEPAAQRQASPAP